MKKASVLLVAIALALFGLAACGDDDDDGGDSAAETTTEATETQAGGGGGGGGATLDVSSPESGDTQYDQDSLTAAAGSVTINYDNPSPVPHDVKVEDESGSEVGGTDLVSDGTGSATVELQPGTYTYFCSVPGHREGGMEGTLTVE